MMMKTTTCTRLWAIPLRFYSSSITATRNISPPTSPPAAQNLIQNMMDYCNQGDLNRAMSALKSMHQRKIFADAVSYTQLIKLCVSHKAIHHARTVHRHVFSDGYEPKTFLINSLLSMYVKFGLFREAHEMFDQMPERNVVSWTTMISAYASCDDDGIKQRALEMLVLMLRDGVQPNMFTYSSVVRAYNELPLLGQIHSCILKVGLESDVYVRSALIDVYSRWGNVEKAMAVFDEMPTGDRVVWNSIIGGFAQNSHGEVALDLYKAMRKAGFQAEESTLTSALRGCTALALLELGRQLHVHVLKYDLDLILNNALLDMYCKCGSLDDAELVFGRMREKDVISWSTMIMGLAQNGFSKLALELFEEMKVSTKIKPNYITILGVLFACSHAGLVDVGQHYFHSMKRFFGIDPGREHYGCIVDLLGRAGKLDEAVKLIQSMPCEPDAVTWRALLGACRVHRNMDLAAYAAKQVIKHDPNEPGTYILLSNIYAKSQKWDEITEVRKAMRRKGINKEPGCSWIEVNKCIHAFIMGDDSHPQISKIQWELKQIIQKLKEVGYVPDTNFVLKDLEGEQMEDSLLYHSEKMAVVFGLMSMSSGKTIRIRKNLRICGDCHVFAKLLAKVENRSIVIRDPIRYHHFQDGHCSCGDYW